MTSQNDNSDKPYKVGYGKPPVDKRFQKGQSGNKRGSKPKIEPSRTKLQLLTDFLSITEQQIAITLNGKQKNVSGFQAVVLKLQQKAMSGDKNAMGLYLQWAKESMQDFTKVNPEVTGMVEYLHRHLMQQPDGPSAEDIRQINKLHRKTRSQN